MLARGKAKAVQRNPKVSLCVLDENWPPTYITLFCDAVIEATVSPTRMRSPTCSCGCSSSWPAAL